MCQRGFHGGLLACIAAERIKYLLWFTVNGQLCFVIKILRQRHIVALQVYQIILFGQDILVFFGCQTCFSSQFTEIIPSRTAISVNRCTGYIHIFAIQIFTIAVSVSHSVISVSHSVKGMQTIRKAK